MEIDTKKLLEQYLENGGTIKKLKPNYAYGGTGLYMRWPWQPNYPLKKKKSKKARKRYSYSRSR